MREVSESLAGRLSVMELTPFLWSELKSEAERTRHWLCGGYPDGGIMTPSRYPTWQIDYLALITQRDLPSWGLPARPQVTTRMLRMLAAVHGQSWNASQVGQSLGLSYATVNSYLDFLVGAFLFRRLEPYLPNLKKRLVKTPKLYWRDTGLLHAVLGVEDRDDLLHRPWVGAGWEGYVIEQALSLLSSVGRPHEAYYFRTSDGYELDLVIVKGRERIAIEIKLTTSPSTDDIRRLESVADMVGASRRYLVTRSTRRMGTGTVIACDLSTLLDELDR